MSDNIIRVQQLPYDKTKHILDDSGRLHWDLLCATRQNKASTWTTDKLSSIDCPHCLSIFTKQNQVLELHGLKRSDAKLLAAGLSNYGNIERDRVQHLIEVGIFTGNPGIVGWGEHGEWLTKETDTDWVRSELTKKGCEIATAIWKTPCNEESESG